MKTCIFVIILSFWYCNTILAFDISFEDKQTNKGEKVWSQVSVYDFKNVGSFYLVIQFDNSKLKFDEFSAFPVPHPELFNYSQKEEGKILVQWGDDSHTVDFANGTWIFKIAFIVLADPIDSTSLTHDKQLSFFKEAGSSIKYSINSNNGKIKILHPIPVLDLTFDNGDLSDVSGNGNDGALIGFPKLATDRFGNGNSAYSFSGDDGIESIYVKPSSSLVFQDKMTISFWFKRDSISGGNGSSVVLSSSDNSGDFNISINNKNVPFWHLWSVGEVGKIDLCKWNHFYSEIDTGGMWKIINYLNGESETYHGGAASNFLKDVLKNGLTIGKAFGIDTYNFNGSVDDIKIFNCIPSKEIREELWGNYDNSKNLIKPVFAQIDTICAGSANPFISYSINGISGDWTPEFDNAFSKLYLFTPNIGQCADTITLYLNIKTCNQKNCNSFLTPDTSVCNNRLPFILLSNQSGIFSDPNGRLKINEDTILTNQMYGSYKIQFIPNNDTCEVEEIEFDIYECQCYYKANPDTIWLSSGEKVEYNILLNDNGLLPTSDFLVEIEINNDLFLNQIDGEGKISLEFSTSAIADTFILEYIISSEECMDRDTSSIVIIRLKQIDILPVDVITPNSDGINDRLRFSAEHVLYNSELSIYNRWGDRIYHKKDYTNDWDASGYPGGVYYYKLRVDGKEINKTLTVVK